MGDLIDASLTRTTAVAARSVHVFAIRIWACTWPSITGTMAT